MGIVRDEPFMDLDTKEVKIFGNHRLTRAQLHRMLKANGVDHPLGASKDQLLEILEVSEIKKELVPPGLIIQEEQEEEEAKPAMLAEDGWPVKVPVLRAWCKARGIPFRSTDKRVDLVGYLEKQMENGSG